MIVHTCHIPSTYSIAAPPATSGHSCSFCYSSNFKPGHACPDCGVTMPSSSSSRSIPPAKRRKLAPTMYLPENDGIHGQSDNQPDELAPYADELDSLHIDHDDNDAADDLPTIADIEDLPWN